MPTSASFAVTVLNTPELARRSMTSGEFAALYCGSDPPFWLYSAPDNMPVYLTVSKGLVVRVDERYMP